MNPVLVVWGNWGPYHHARFRAFRELAARQGVTVEGIELFPTSDIYAWKSDLKSDGVHHLAIGTNEMAFRPWQLTTQLAPLILRLKPSVVFVPAYWHWSLYLNVVSRIAGARIVMMNESHAGTERARGLKKWIKRRIVSSFHAALVGGSPHRRFFSELGLDEDRIFLGYDAIDNAHFRQVAAQARAEETRQRERLGLPPRYFLSLGRFVKKKNLSLLLEAYAQLRPAADGAHHHLAFVGSGELEHALRARAQELSLKIVDHPENETVDTETDADKPVVHFFGFRQVEENPVFYAFATAFVLPSSYEEWGLVVNEAMACEVPVLVSNTLGCAEDLVASGENGFTFDPTDASALARAMQSLVDHPDLAASMGTASGKRIATWGCDRFAAGALQACRTALST